jgi:hypothetical protein
MTKLEDSGKKLRKKRLTKGAPSTSSDVDEPMKHPSCDEEDEGIKRGTGKKKRFQLKESDDEDSGQPDIENRNIPNQPISVAPPKGKRKVKKTRTYFDEKGYLVNEDYSSYEEYDAPQNLPPISQMVKKEPIKRVV